MTSPVHILAINCGSSSIKCAVSAEHGARPFELRIEGLGGGQPYLTAGGTRRPLDAKLDPCEAVDCALAELQARWPELGRIDAVVHRVVHGGEGFTAPVLIDDAVLARLGALECLAPLHNPPALHAIRGTRQLFAVPQVAVFDTAFHATLPRRAREYALPDDVRAEFGIRRYGFHGISHADVAARAAAHLDRPQQELRIVSCHLGAGASITAIEYGRSVETSMGMTPLEGLVMGTRAGDLDPGALLELARALPAGELEDLLQRRCGLLGLTGSEDFADIERRAAEGDERCRLAIGLCTHRIRKYIGAYAAVMGGVDVIAFTGGIGEHSALLRHRCLQRLGFLGAALDEERNRLARVDARTPLLDIATGESRVRVLVLRADEEAAMAAMARKLLAAVDGRRARVRIPIAVSARHVHLTQQTVNRLFGRAHELQPLAALAQTGQFAAQETVRIIGPRGSLDGVRVVGPARSRDQVEIPRSDEFTLGIDAPVRISGDLTNTPGVTLEGPHGRVTLANGVICSRRHIHMNPDDARRLGVSDCDNVSVHMDSNGRDVTFGDVSVRVAPQFTLELHLDTDEANAAQVRSGDFAELVGGPPRGGG